MEGHYVHKGTQDNTNYIVTENEPYENSSLTHRRSVFHANKEFFVLVDELYMKNPEEAYNTGKYNLNFNLCAPENEITFDNSNSKAAHGILTTVIITILLFIHHLKIMIHLQLLKATYPMIMVWLILKIV